MKSESKTIWVAPATVIAALIILAAVFSTYSEEIREGAKPGLLPVWIGLIVLASLLLPVTWTTVPKEERTFRIGWIKIISIVSLELLSFAVVALFLILNQFGS